MPKNPPLAIAAALICILSSVVVSCDEYKVSRCLLNHSAMSCNTLEASPLRIPLGKEMTLSLYGLDPIFIDTILKNQDTTLKISQANGGQQSFSVVDLKKQAGYIDVGLGAGVLLNFHVGLAEVRLEGGGTQLTTNLTLFREPKFALAATISEDIVTWCDLSRSSGRPNLVCATSDLIGQKVLKNCGGTTCSDSLPSIHLPIDCETGAANSKYFSVCPKQNGNIVVSLWDASKPHYEYPNAAKVTFVGDPASSTFFLSGPGQLDMFSLSNAGVSAPVKLARPNNALEKLTAGDINNDQQTDLIGIAGNMSSAISMIVWQRVAGEDKFVRNALFSDRFTDLLRKNQITRVDSMVVGDIDQDNLPDIVFSAVQTNGTDGISGTNAPTQIAVISYVDDIAIDSQLRFLEIPMGVSSGISHSAITNITMGFYDQGTKTDMALVVPRISTGSTIYVLKNITPN